MAKFLTSKLDLATMRDSLINHTKSFLELETTDQPNFRRKLSSSTILFVLDENYENFAPLPWLLVQLAGGNWNESNYRDWIMPPENYRAALLESGMQVVKNGDMDFEKIRKAYCSRCETSHFLPSKNAGNNEAQNREFWVPKTQNPYYFIDEVSESEIDSYPEGTLLKRFVNSYERNPAARSLCIEKFGTNCSVCRINFEEMYGGIGYGFIHVHHKVQLSKAGKNYNVDPILDLIPLCPNCHAMIHKLEDIADVETLISKLKFRFD